MGCALNSINVIKNLYTQRKWINYYCVNKTIFPTENGGIDFIYIYISEVFTAGAASCLRLQRLLT